LSAGFITMLDVSIVNVALPSMERSLQAGPTQLQLIVAGYTLAFGLALVPAGRLGDVFGRRALFIVGVAGFGVMSLVAGLSTSDTMLSLCRLGQGIAGGILNPQVSGLIQQMFRGVQRGRAFGMFGGTIGVATALGPLAGGLLIAAGGPEHGWRWVFFINVPIVLTVIPLAARLLPAQAKCAHKVRVDSVGVTLIGIATVAFMVPFVISGDTGEDAIGWQRWLCPVVAVALAAPVYFWERFYQRRYQAAAINPALLRNADFRYGAAVGMIYFAGFTAIFLVVTLVLQDGMGYTALQAGLVGMPFAVASGVSAWLSGRMVARWGRSLVVAGISVALVGLLATDLVLRLTPEHAMGWVAGATLLVAGAGSGVVISPNQTLTLARVPVGIGSTAGAVIQVGQRIGTCVGISAVLAGFFTERRIFGPRRAAADSLLLSAALLALALVVAALDARRRNNSADAVPRGHCGPGGGQGQGSASGPGCRVTRGPGGRAAD
jgi:MFS family permease